MVNSKYYIALYANNFLQAVLRLNFCSFFVVQYELGWCSKQLEAFPLPKGVGTKLVYHFGNPSPEVR